MLYSDDSPNPPLNGYTGVFRVAKLMLDHLRLARRYQKILQSYMGISKCNNLKRAASRTSRYAVAKQYII